MSGMEETLNFPFTVFFVTVKYIDTAQVNGILKDRIVFQPVLVL